MALTVTHAHHSAIADDGSDVGSNNWNAAHTLTGSVAASELTGNIDLSSQVTGNLATSHLNSATSASSSTFWCGNGAWINPLSGFSAKTPAGSDLTFYVATTGNDSNVGSVGSPFKTIQYALNVVAGYDWIGNFRPIINVVAGTYAENLILPVLTNATKEGWLLGDETTPANVILSGASGPTAAIRADGGVEWFVSGFEFQGSTTYGISVNYGSIVDMGAINMNGPPNPFHCEQAELGLNVGPIIVKQVNGNFITGKYGLFPWENCSITLTTGPMTNANFFLDLEGGNCQVQLENATYTNFSSWADGGGSSIVALNSSIVNTRNGLISDVPGATAVPGSNLFADVTCWITSINSNFATNLGSAFGYVDRTVVTSTSTNYTLGFANAGNIIEMNNAGANTVTVPSSATVNFPVGAKVTVVQAGAGATSPSTASGATIHGVAALAGQWKSAVLYKRAADEWVQLSGAF